MRKGGFVVDVVVWNEVVVCCSGNVQVVVAVVNVQKLNPRPTFRPVAKDRALFLISQRLPKFRKFQK